MSECQNKEIRTLAQKRAAFALRKVEEILSNYKSLDNKNFKSFASGAPSMILQNGLGQALAFWLAKASKFDENSKKQHIDFEKKKEGFLLKIITEWFQQSDNPYNLLVSIENTPEEKNDRKKFNIMIKSFVEKIFCNLNQKDFLSIQKETLALLEWFKRYAEAFLSDEESKNKEEN
ncbi:MAG: type III-B CRISPR module-associated protein Cmr5 [Brevinematia bacterium]